MSKTLRSSRQQRLIELLVERRKQAGLSQAVLAAVLGFDPHEVLDLVLATPRRRV